MSKSSQTFDIGVDILKTYLDPTTNSVLAQTGSVTEGIARSDGAELWQSVGLVSRPANPIAGKSAAQGIAIRCSDRDRIIATRDARGQAIYGNLSDGETCLYAGGPNGTGQAKVFLRSDGSASLVTTDTNTANGNTIKLSVSPVPLQGIVAFSPWGSYKMNVTGYHLMTAAGARMDGGGVSAPGLPAAVGSYWTFSAASCSLQSSTVNLGPTRAAQTPVMLSTPALLLIGNMQLEIAAIAATVASLLPISGATTLQVAAVATALQNFTLASTALIASSPSTSTNSN